MKDTNIQDIPDIHPEIEAKSKEIGFTMPSDLFIGTLLKTLMSSKPNGRFLELGTGIGLSLSWMADGLQGKEAHLTSVDNDPELIAIAEDFFGPNDQISLVCQDGTEWIKAYDGPEHGRDCRCQGRVRVSRKILSFVYKLTYSL